MSLYKINSAKNEPNGIAGLNASGKLPSSLMSTGGVGPVKVATTAPSTVATLILNLGRESYGGVDADGFFLLDKTAQFSKTDPGITEVLPTAGATTSTSSAVITNKLFMMPDHDAFTLSGFFASIVVGLGVGPAGYTGYIDKVELLVCSISSGGVETVRETHTNTTLSSKGSASGAPYSGYRYSFDNPTSSYTFAAGERMAFRIKTYGHSSSTSAVTNQLINATGGTGSSSGTSDYIMTPSVVALYI